MRDSEPKKPISEKFEPDTESSPQEGSLAEALLEIIKEKNPRLGLILSNPENHGQGSEGLKGR